MEAPKKYPEFFIDSCLFGYILVDDKPNFSEAEDQESEDFEPIAYME